MPTRSNEDGRWHEWMTLDSWPIGFMVDLLTFTIKTNHSCRYISYMDPLGAEWCCQASCPSAPRSACWHGATARAPATTVEPPAIAPPAVATPAVTTPALTPAASASVATSSAPALEMVEVQTVMLPKSIIVVWGLKQKSWMISECGWMWMYGL